MHTLGQKLELEGTNAPSNNFVIGHLCGRAKV